MSIFSYMPHPVGKAMEEDTHEDQEEETNLPPSDNALKGHAQDQDPVVSLNNISEEEKNDKGEEEEDNEESEDEDDQLVNPKQRGLASTT